MQTVLSITASLTPKDTPNAVGRFALRWTRTVGRAPPPPPVGRPCTWPRGSEAVMRCHLRPSHACPKSASPAAAVRMAHGTAGYSPWHLPSADVECGYLISAPLPRTAVRSVPMAWSSVSPAPCARWPARSSSPLVLAVRPRRATATARRCFRLGVDGRAPDDRERRRVRRLPASIPTSPASSVSP